MKEVSIGRGSIEREGETSVDFVYVVPYTDRWGEQHDPTTWWDELLKYYKHNVRLIVSEATRQLAQPASTEAIRLVRSALKRHRRNLRKAHKLEASYLKQRSLDRRGAALQRTEALEAQYLKEQFHSLTVQQSNSQKQKP